MNSVPRYYAITQWSPHDVQTLRPFWSLERCEQWLEQNQKYVADRLVELGWDVIRDLLDPEDSLVIYSANEQGFWSNDSGWGEFESATVFSAAEAKTFALPLSTGGDAKWSPITEAERSFGPHPGRDNPGSMAPDATADELGKIMAKFVPQAETDRGKYIVDIDGAREIDVTAKVLAMNLTDLSFLQDDQCETDDLVDVQALGHNGPYRIEVVEAVKAFFGVEDLDDITEEALEEARELRGIEGEYKLIVAYAVLDPGKLEEYDNKMDEVVGSRFDNAGTFFVGVPQRDLEFFFDTKALAMTALAKVEAYAATVPEQQIEARVVTA